MGKRKLLSVISLLLILTLLITACAKGYKEDKNSSTKGDTTGSYPGYDMTNEVTSQEEPKAEEGESAINNSSTVNSGAGSVQIQDKIIRRFFMDVETQEFDELLTTVDAEINRLGGYVESSQISGRSYGSDYDSRYGEVIVRIPSERVDDFVNSVKENSNVVNRKEETENVTLEYIDIESRKEALEIEQERLFAILEKEVSLDNIITLESRLNDIRYELQKQESQLRYYDNLVQYSTVTLNIQEVERMTKVTEKKPTVGQRIRTGFSNTMYQISEGLKNFFVWFVVNLPYLLIWGIIIAVGIVISRKIYKKSKATQRAYQPANYYGSLSGQQNQGQQNQGQQNQGQQNQSQQNQSQQNQGQQTKGQ